MIDARELVGVERVLDERPVVRETAHEHRAHRVEVDLVGVGSEEVSSLADFYKKIWARGAAGIEVPLRVLQGTQVRDVNVRSIDRIEYFRAKPML